MEKSVKISSKYQIVIPKEIRRALRLEKGDELVFVAEGGVIYLKAKPRSYVEHMKGLHRELWEDMDVNRYLQREKETWEGLTSRLKGKMK